MLILPWWMTCLVLILVVFMCSPSRVLSISTNSPILNRLQNKTLVSNCTTSLDCNFGSNAICKAGKCSCAAGFQQDKTLYCVPQCSGQSVCDNPYWFCRSDGRCGCGNEQVLDKYKGTCVADRNINIRYDDANEIGFCESDWICGVNAFCVQKRCRCKVGYRPASNGVNCEGINCTSNWHCTDWHKGTTCDTGSNTCQCDEFAGYRLDEWTNRTSCQRGILTPPITVTVTTSLSTTTDSTNVYDDSLSSSSVQILISVIILVILAITLYALCSCINCPSRSKTDPPFDPDSAELPPKYEEAIHFSRPLYFTPSISSVESENSHSNSESEKDNNNNNINHNKINCHCDCHHQ